MAVTIQQLVAGGIAPSDAPAVAKALRVAARAGALNTPRRQAAFLGQCMVESNRFTDLAENLYYTTPARLMAVFPSYVKTEAVAKSLLRNPQRLANYVYANRLGNGDEASGDGWAFRGSGPLGVTGRANFAVGQARTGIPFLTEPERARTLEDGLALAAAWWAENGCNALADNWSMAALTRRVNGPAALKSAEREAAATRLLKALA